MARAGPKEVQRYSLEFKRTAVYLSQRLGMQVQAVAEGGPPLAMRMRCPVPAGRVQR